MTQADVIVVLGAAVWSGGRPSPALEGRVAHGLRLLRNGVAPRMILTGGLGSHPPTEAEVMCRLAVAGGADPEQLVLEDRSVSTMESARRCAEMMRIRGWRTAVVVTDGYHLPRSLMGFRAFGVDARGSASAGGRAAALGRPRWALTLLRESAAFISYAIRLKRPWPPQG